MLMAHPAILENQVARYEATHAQLAQRGTPEAQQRLDDATYTLCVSTGTSDIDSALRAADRQLSAACVDDRIGRRTGERRAAVREAGGVRRL